MKFKAAKGAMFTDSDAQKIGSRVEVVRKNSGGLLSTGAIVADARKKDSPLHKFFEWDNERAAERLRLSQAGDILRHLLVVVETPDGRKEIKGYHSVIVQVEGSELGEEAEPTRVYVTTGQAFADTGLRQQVIKDALDRLETWRERYQGYKEFAPVYDSIGLVRKQLGQ